ncbi:MAG TPA: hypothetical protein VH417_09195 [Vicinamibacterales bacterium]|jgi:hypothetical protein
MPVTFPGPARGVPALAVGDAQEPQSHRLSPARAALLPLACAAALAAIGLFDGRHDSHALRWSLFGAAGVLAAGAAILYAAARRSGRQLAIELVARRQHYLQACAQGSVLLYWGWYWREVYHSADLLVAQLLFAYAVDMLINWAQRDRYTLGFAPFPVIFSINLFLWFKPDWFYLQFLMVATGFAAKALIRWQKNGRPAHIFNPSSFPLAVFSLALIVTGASDMTWGQSIASTQFYPPQMYAMLFLIGLPGQFFFGVTSMTLAAVVATYLFGLVYFAATGVYFFYDSYIPIAVFLGMHLLFTDPSTSPSTELGRIIFGIVYGLSTVALYALLTRAGVPAFYDKLLQVPLMNLSITLIDRAARSPLLRRLDPSPLGQHLAPRGRNLAYIGVWTLVFVVMSAAGGVGDDHPGQWLPFWQRACAANRAGACDYAANLEAGYCESGSGWGCNEAGIAQARRANYAASADAWQRGCALGFTAACANRNAKSVDGALHSASPTLDDLPILGRGSKGPIADRSPAALRSAACRAGWLSVCQ